ncbi:hypothetical protein Pla22_36150 [Rubripirellula amarantea]|uniref:Uncharacterized protein n=1 Tax=Rubripirellula amarantea TaxID=2527999 RepID=A0A5C5WM58_9BACT|nr:hypothetical protein Pla22_36150 [Rubripirellula amarantea]
MWDDALVQGEYYIPFDTAITLYLTNHGSASGQQAMFESLSSYFYKASRLPIQTTPTNELLPKASSVNCLIGFLSGHSTAANIWV